MSKSHKSYTFSLVATGLLVVSMLSIFILQPRSASPNLLMLTGIMTLSGGVLGLIGFIFSIAGLRDKNDWKKIVGFVLNLLISTLFLGILIASMMDIYEALK